MDPRTYETMDPGMDLWTMFLLQSTNNEYLRQINNELDKKKMRGHKARLNCEGRRYYYTSTVA